MANARSETLPVLRLSCDTAPDALCRSMMQALSTHSGGQFDVRIVPDADMAPGRVDDLGVALVLDGQGPGWIAAHLDWQHGPDGPRHQGPSLEMSVMDAPLTARMYDRYADNLISADAGMVALLSK